MIDIGVNLTNSRFDKDRNEVISRALDSGVQHLIVTGTNIQESLAAAELCQTYPETLYMTAGVHPHDADNVAPDYLSQIEALSQQGYVKAVGECGLDFNRNFSAPAQQISVFREQVALAEKLQMPLFLHQRDAFDDWFAILKPYFDKVPAMIAHCFTGSAEELKSCIDAGMYVGITGWVCDERRGGELREVIPEIPLERLLIETDAPYLTPRTIRPKPKSSRNEPSYLPYVAQEIAALMEISLDKVVTATLANTRKAFGLEVA